MAKWRAKRPVKDARKFIEEKELEKDSVETGRIISLLIKVFN
jgi:hypothetical protein